MSTIMTRRYLILAIGVVSVAFAAIFIRLAEAPSIVIAAYRLCIAVLILTPFALTHGRNELLHLHRRDILLAICSGAFLAIHFALWIASLRYTTVTSSVVLVTIAPFSSPSFLLHFFTKKSRSALLPVLLSPSSALSLSGSIIGNWAAPRSKAVFWHHWEQWQSPVICSLAVN